MGLQHPRKWLSPVCCFLETGHSLSYLGNLHMGLEVIWPQLQTGWSLCPLPGPDL